MTFKLWGLVRKIWPFVLLVLLGYSIFAAVKFILKQIGTWPPSTVSVIVSALLALMGFIGVLIQKDFDKRRDIELKLREEKVKTYEQVMDLIFYFNKLSSLGMEFELNEENADKFNSVSKSIILWGSDNAVKYFTEFRMNAVHADVMGPQHLIISLGKTLLEFRKDLGHKNKNLTVRDVLGTYINDVDALFNNLAIETAVEENVALS